MDAKDMELNAETLARLACVTCGNCHADGTPCPPPVVAPQRMLVVDEATWDRLCDAIGVAPTEEDIARAAHEARMAVDSGFACERCGVIAPGSNYCPECGHRIGPFVPTHRSEDGAEVRVLVHARVAAGRYALAPVVVYDDALRASYVRGALDFAQRFKPIV